MSEKLHARIRKYKQRIAIRRWRYRQRRHSAGVWDRFRHVLASAQRAYAIEPTEMRALLAEGYQEEEVGGNLEPKKRIIFVSVERAALLKTSKELDLSLTAPLLLATEIVLVRF